MAVKEVLEISIDTSLLSPAKVDIDIAKSVEVPKLVKPMMTGKDEFESNIAAFKSMQKSLENDPQYRGKYVVIYKGNLVAHGDDRDKLLSEVYKKYGYASLIVRKVGEHRVMRVYSPRFVRND